MEYSGLLFEIGKPTANGTIYSIDMMEGAIKRFKDEGKHFGKIYYDHHDPMDCNIGDISHEVTDIEILDKGEGRFYAMATINTLGTHMGKIADKIIGNSALALSGFCKVGEDGTVSDLTIKTVDIVERNSGLLDQTPVRKEPEKQNKIDIQ